MDRDINLAASGRSKLGWLGYCQLKGFYGVFITSAKEVVIVAVSMCRFCQQDNKIHV